MEKKKISNLNKYEKKGLFSFAIFSHIAFFIDKGLEDVKFRKELSEMIFKIKTETRNYILINRLNDDEISLLKFLETEDFVENMSKDHAFLVTALELMRIYIEETPDEFKHKFYISEKKLKLGYRLWFKPMMALKLTNKKEHAEKKEIIDDSIKVARFLYDFMKKNILEA